MRYFHTPLPFDATLRRYPPEYCHEGLYGKTRIMWLLDGKKSLTCLAVLSEYRRVTDGQTDRRTNGRTDRQTDRQIHLATPQSALCTASRGNKRPTNNVVIGGLQVLLDEFFKEIADTEQTIRCQQDANRHQCRYVSSKHGDWLQLLQLSLADQLVWHEQLDCYRRCHAVAVCWPQHIHTSQHSTIIAIKRQ